MTQWRWPATWALAIAVTSAACTGPPRSSAPSFREAQAQAAREAAVEIAQAEEAFTACMRADGYHGEDARLPDQDPPAESPTTSDLGTEPAEVGYGFAPVALALTADGGDLASEPEDPGDGVDPTELDAARQRCERSSGLLDVPDALAAFADRAGEARARVTADAGYRKAWEDWSRCMASAGFPGVPDSDHLAAAAEVALATLPVAESDATVVIAGIYDTVSTSDPLVQRLAAEVFGGAASLEDLARREREVASTDESCQDATHLEERLAAALDRAFAETGRR